MGSCISSINASPPPKSPSPSDSKISAANRNGTSKSPPLPEEETVKEVLTESPAIPQNLPPIFNVNQFLLNNTACARQRRRSGTASLGFDCDNPTIPDENASEIPHTRSERTSVSMKRNDAVGNGGLRQTLRKQLPERSGNGSFPGKKVKRAKTAGGKHPGRRNGIGSGFGCVWRIDSTANAGERSGRRRSLVTGTGLGSDPGGAQSRMETGRPSGSGGETRKMEVKEDKWAPTNELLENPAMSLECFIFL